MEMMAGALGFEPRNFLIQSQAPYQLGHAPAGAGKATTVYQPPPPSEADRSGGKAGQHELGRLLHVR